MHENGPADCLGLRRCLEGAFGHRAGFRAPDARLGKLVFGTSDKSGLSVAGSLVCIFSARREFRSSEFEKEKLFKGPVVLPEQSEKKKIYPQVSTCSLEREKVMEES